MQTPETVAMQMGIDNHGDAAQLKPMQITLAAPADREVRVRHTAIGVNYVDIYHRIGRYRLPALPAPLGVEATGVVQAVGAKVTHLMPGQRVAYAGVPAGSYATERNIPAEQLVSLPDDVADDSVAALLLRGITAHMLLTQLWPVKPGDTLLIHAAAGGLGLVLVQWARTMGARVIGTVGSEAKATLARKHGLHETILYRERDFVAATRELTGGRGADLVIDGIGGEVLRRSLDAARPFGLVASVGQVDGHCRDVDLAALDAVPGVALCRPSVIRYMRDVERYRAGARATIASLQAGMKAHIDTVLPLSDAADAHRRLESGRSAGAILLRP